MESSQLGAERIIAMSRHEPRQRLAITFGATDIVTERGDAGVARIKELTGDSGRTRSRGGRHPEAVLRAMAMLASLIIP